jgi:gluconokinase
MAELRHRYSGSGKSAIGEDLAKKLNYTYIDGDDFHPALNIEKMANGEPLTDNDRWPWLEIVARKLSSCEGVAIAGCSVLKKSYREFIASFIKEPVQFIFLDGSYELINGRMAAREGHFMPTSLLKSQFETLEMPENDENHISVSIEGTKEQVVEAITMKIQEQFRSPL